MKDENVKGSKIKTLYVKLDNKTKIKVTTNNVRFVLIIAIEKKNLNECQSKFEIIGQKLKITN